MAKFKEAEAARLVAQANGSHKVVEQWSEEEDAKTGPGASDGEKRDSPSMAGRVATSQ
jgi:hypothetical protein